MLNFNRKNKQLKEKIEDKSTQLKSLEILIDNLKDKLKKDEKTLNKNETYANSLRQNCDNLNKKLIDSYKNNLNVIICSIEKDINDRDLETEKNQSIYNQELEKINKELICNKSKLSRLESHCYNVYKRDCSKDLKLILEQIAEFMKNNYKKIKTSHKEFSPTDEILKYCAENFFYRLIKDLYNMMSMKKINKICELSVQLDYLKKYRGFEELYSKIEELSCKVSEESIPEKFKTNFIDPIKRIFDYKSFTAQIKSLNREIIDLEENKSNIICKSLEKYSLKCEYTDITKDTKDLEEQIKENKEELYKYEVEIVLQKKDIQTVIDNIYEKCQTLTELETKKVDLELEYEVTKKQIDEKMAKTLKYISKYCKDEKCRLNVEEEISNYLEGSKFDRDKIESGFYEIYKECIDNPTNECLAILSQYKYECESILESMKENGEFIKKKIKTGLEEFDQINQDNITSFNQLTAQVVNDLNNVNILVSKIKEENDSIEESRKSNSSYVNELSQYFDEIYNKWNSIEEIPQNTNFDDILSCIIKLKQKSDESKEFTDNFFKSVKDEKEK